jgi:large subunit ribosomal protein L35Ae
LNGPRETLIKNFEGIIVGYRKGLKTQNPKECLIKFSGIETINEVGRLVGRKVAWPPEERKHIGKIVALHGKNGIVRARFRKGVLGQALGSRVRIIG